MRSGAALCADSTDVYAAFARTTAIAQRPLNLQRDQRVVDGAFPIRNVNAYDSRLQGSMRRIHDVASQYLEDHLGWRRMVQRHKTAMTPKSCLAEAVGRPINRQFPQSLVRW